MNDRFAISSDIEIAEPESQLPALDANERLLAAAALVGILRHAGLDCHLVTPEKDDSGRAIKCDADESGLRKATKTTLQ